MAPSRCSSCRRHRIAQLLVGLLAMALAACETTVTSSPANVIPIPRPYGTSHASPSPEPSASTMPSVEPSEPIESETPAIPGCGEVIAAIQPKEASSRPLAVLGTEQGIGLYDIRADVVRTVESTTEESGYRPRFRTAAQVTFVRGREPSDESHTFGQESLFEVDLESGKVQEIIRLPNHVLAFEWSPDGAVLAYLVAAETERRVQASPLCLFDTRTGVTTEIKSLSYTIGRGGNQWDERSIAWSPSAASLLVLDTVQDPQLYVVDLEGRNVIPPRAGTFARWLSDGRVVYLEDSNHLVDGGQWRSVSTDTGLVRTYPLPESAFRAVFSPNGRFIAYDDGERVPSVYLFDLETGASRLLGHGYVAPVWLGSGRIAATAAGRCPRSYFCVIPWLASDKTIGIDRRTGERERLALPTTLQGAVVNGAIDVLLPET